MLAVVGALVVAFGLALVDDPGQPHEGTGAPAERIRRDADTRAALAGPRQRADLLPCPAEGSGAGPEELRGIIVECAADGSRLEVARALAGRTVVLNLWSYWCAPCAQELPALASYQDRAGDSVTVVTVHQDENETAALLRMAELGVRLPTLQDGRRSIAADGYVGIDEDMMRSRRAARAVPPSSSLPAQDGAFLFLLPCLRH